MTDTPDKPMLSFWDLTLTIAPWKIGPDGDGGLTKKLAMTGPVTQYEYGTTSKFRTGYVDRMPTLENGRWQRAIILSPGSKVYVVDIDNPELIPDDFPFPLDGAQQSTGAPGKRHLFIDGSNLAPEDFPRQWHFPWGDIKSAGFVPYPGSMHPYGAIYTLTDGYVPKGVPEWTRWLEENYESTPAVYSGERGPNDPGSGRNNWLASVKGYYIGIGYSEEDANAEVILANEGLDVPLSDGELDRTVLKPKKWAGGEAKLVLDQEISQFGDHELLEPIEEHGESGLVLLDQPSSGPLKLLNLQVRRWVRTELKRDLGFCRAWRDLWARGVQEIRRLVIETGSALVELTAATLAEAISCSQYQASRLLRKMHDAGAIEHTYGKVRIRIPKVRKSVSPRKIQLIPRAYAQVVLRAILPGMLGDGPERVSQRHMTERANEYLSAVSKWERMSLHRTRQVLGDLRKNRELSRTSLHKPETDDGGKTWQSLPAEWALGHHPEEAEPPKRSRRRSGGHVHPVDCSPTLAHGLSALAHDLLEVAA